MRLLSQRDPQWSNIEVGTGGRSIGQVGCTITCLAMLADVTPDVVNQKLNSLPKDANGNTGYAQGNLVIWGKVPQALPNLQFIKRGSPYNNDEVKNNLPCMVEVNGAPIGGYRHWVIYIGNQQLYDPWDGKQKSTAVYQTTGYAVFKVNTPSVNWDDKVNRMKTALNAGGTSEARAKEADKIFHS